jgi:hypothetical protein
MALKNAPVGVLESIILPHKPAKKCLPKHTFGVAER